MASNIPAHLPFAESCEYNQSYILEVLKRAFRVSTNPNANANPKKKKIQHVLEIGSGTGQHSVYFAPRLGLDLVWQTSEVASPPSLHEGINAWHAHAPSPNLRPPVVMDLSDPDSWPAPTEEGKGDNNNNKYYYDGVYTSNTLHIVSWPLVQNLFVLLGRHLPPGGVFAVYGPFNYNGTFTTESNKAFDAWLKGRDPLSGIRHFEEVVALARANGLELVEDCEMPENNRTLVFEKKMEEEEENANVEEKKVEDHTK